MKTCLRSYVSVLLSLSLASGVGLAQDPAPQAPASPKYKLTIVEGASTAKRVKKGRVSAQSVIKVTDENDVPVPGVVVAFTLPQLTGGAAFANGGLTSIVTTNAAGVASSGSFTAAAGTSFSVSATASVSGSAISVSVPVTAASTAAAAAAGAGAAGAAAAGAGGGLSTLAIVGIVVGGAIVAGAAAAAVKLSGGSGMTTPVGPQGTIGAASGFSFGPPH